MLSMFLSCDWIQYQWAAMKLPWCMVVWRFGVKNVCTSESGQASTRWARWSRTCTPQYPWIKRIRQAYKHNWTTWRLPLEGWRGTIESCVRAIRNFRRLQMKSCKWSKLWPTVLKETQSQPVSAPWVVILRFWTAWPMPHENLVQTGLLESMRAFPRILKTRSILGKTQGASETRTTRQAQQKLNFPFLGHGSISEFHYVHELIVSIFWKVWNYVYACQPTFWNPTCAGQ